MNAFQAFLNLSISPISIPYLIFSISFVRSLASPPNDLAKDVILPTAPPAKANASAFFLNFWVSSGVQGFPP